MKDLFQKGEKRTTPRLGTVLRVDYRVSGRHCADFVEDISMGGMFIATADPLEPGTRLTMDLLVPGAQDPLRLSGVVAWVRSRPASAGQRRGMGIQFDGLDQAQVQGVLAIVSLFGKGR